ncbi:Secreted protein OS=Kitasatospora aureofaciens OX=1894 GN=GCM10010502_49550 PE=4 SV=1 [Kitasatospora aureofaciens]|nr:hypothetical protein CP971_27480 [Streptomyces viridifaciens]
METGAEGAGTAAGTETAAEPDGGGATPRVGLQVGAAVVLVGVLFAGLWVLAGRERDGVAPAKCTAATEKDSPKYPALCAALNRPDQPVLVGVPEERVLVAQPGLSAALGPGLTKEDYGSAEVQFRELYVELADHGDVDVADFPSPGDPTIARTPVLGHQALVYRSPTISFSIPLGGGKSTTGTGSAAHSLAVAKNQDGTGGTFEVSIWRKDSGPIDDATLYRVAEAVLPGLQGWAGETVGGTPTGGTPTGGSPTAGSPTAGSPAAGSPTGRPTTG